jgi:predicted DNA-binding transcriptional regulator YafY
VAPVSDSRLGRLLGIVLRLRTEEWISAPTLAHNFGTSLRTIYRDVASLQKHGVPIVGTPGRDGGYRLAGEDAITPLLLSSNEALTLFLLGAAGSDVPNPLGPRTQALAAELRKHLAAEDLQLLSEARSRVFFDTSDWYWKDQGSLLLQPVRDAVFRNETIRIEILERDADVEREVVIQPYGIVWKAGQWYVVGDDGGETRRYRLDRIKSAATTGAKFEVPEDFELRRWWTEDLERFGKGGTRVVLHVRGTAQDEMLGLRLKSTSEVERFSDHTSVVLYVNNWTWLIPLVLSYGADVCVEEPASLRDAIASALAAALSRYRGSSQGKEGRLSKADDSRRRATRGRRPE